MKSLDSYTTYTGFEKWTVISYKKIFTKNLNRDMQYLKILQWKFLSENFQMFMSKELFVSVGESSWERSAKMNYS